MWITITEKFMLDFFFNMEIGIPKSIRNSNATLKIKIYYDIEVGQEYITVNNQDIGFENKLFKTRLNVKDCPYSRICRINFKRSMSETSFKKWKNTRYTGMQVTWNFTPKTNPEETVTFSAFANIFCKLANIIHETENKNALRAELEEKRPNISDTFFSSNIVMLPFESVFDSLFSSHENVSTEPINSKNYQQRDSKQPPGCFSPRWTQNKQNL